MEAEEPSLNAVVAVGLIEGADCAVPVPFESETAAEGPGEEGLTGPSSSRLGQFREESGLFNLSFSAFRASCLKIL